jgi:hypothetical protein
VVRTAFFLFHEGGVSSSPTGFDGGGWIVRNEEKAKKDEKTEKRRTNVIDKCNSEREGGSRRK